MNKRFGENVKSVTVRQEHLREMIQVMDEICKSKNQYGRFASHFFVIDCRAMKDATTLVVRQSVNTDEEEASKIPVEEGDTLFEKVKEKYSYLDWDHMMERKNGGQLVLDLGMGFHPVSDSGTPLVCLWKLDRLRNSYDAAGMNKGTTHRVNTFDLYGGIQAEMETVRRRIVQIQFRQSYGLHYQPTRRGKGGDITFCSDLDAYDVNATFRQSIDTFVEMLTGGCEKSYGARDEVRASGMAIKDVLGNVTELVRTCVSQHSMMV
jgi:hypothetical protein